MRGTNQAFPQPSFCPRQNSLPMYISMGVEGSIVDIRMGICCLVELCNNVPKYESTEIYHPSLQRGPWGSVERSTVLAGQIFKRFSALNSVKPVPKGPF
jgi:hypothetical protein